MDAVIFIAFTLILTCKSLFSKEDSSSTNTEVVVEDTTTRTTKLNDAFYDDPEAFSDMIRGLNLPVCK